jgi:hypothetical protein
VSFLKRLFGETDAVEDARRRAGAAVTEVSAEGYEGHRRAGARPS